LRQRGNPRRPSVSAYGPVRRRMGSARCRPRPPLPVPRYAGHSSLCLLVPRDRRGSEQ
jgi:hypothetical protein